MGRTTRTEKLGRNVIALRSVIRRGSDASHELEPVEKSLREEMDDSLSKASAARLLGVSVNTLDKWIARGLVPTVQRSSRAPKRVQRDALLDLADHAAELRRVGRDQRVLAEAISRLQQADPRYKREFDELYGESLRATRAGDVVPATVPEDFGPED